MGVCVVGVDVRAAPIAFDGIGEVRAKVPPEIVGEARFTAARLACQRGRPLTGADCAMCPRFHDWREGPAPSELTIRCAWSDRDRVANRMTPVPALVIVPADLDARDADEYACFRAVHHLLVVTSGRLAGVVCRCDLAEGGDRLVGELMTRDVYAIQSRATLGEAAAVMTELQIRCLPVIDDGLLVGILTRRDLTAVGVPEERFAVHRCRTCGSRRCVHHDPRTGADACARCIAEPEPDLSAYEFGEGD